MKKRKKKLKCHTSSNHHFGYDVVIIDTVSVQKRGVSLSDNTFHMNERCSFRSLLQVVSSVHKNLEMSGDNGVGAIGPIFDPRAQQVGSQDSQTAVGLPAAKPYQTFV